MAPATVGAQTTASAKALLDAIYRPYLRQGYEGTRLDRPGDYFTAPVAQAIARDHKTAEKNNEAPQLDGDPFIDAQDFELSDLAITIDGQDDKASAIVTFKNSGRPTKIVLDLVRTPAGWRIDDIHWAKLSLRALYKLR
ncbi:MAG: DUF3828 domain-containing protein [Reyranellaceae bacterium]